MNRSLSRSAALAAILTAYAVIGVSGETKQECAQGVSNSSMEVDTSVTVHVFKMTEQGGIERLMTRGLGVPDQVAFLQAQLRHEATDYKAGNYSQPAKLPGVGMPGVKELQEGAADIKVSYTDLPNGAEIALETTNLTLLTAIHRWFGAQLFEHSASARPE